jgi:DNA-binding MarR family transcriptional regulator
MDGPLLSTLVRRLHLWIRQQIHADLVAAGHGRLTPAHMYIFQLPGPDGVRPTELARRTNMTKQAMNHLLAGLERDGYLHREPAPDDGRGTVIRLTAASSNSVTSLLGSTPPSAPHPDEPTRRRTRPDRGVRDTARESA